jgi:2-polyprenyl-6-methoxyphenol hydroxylase-like FAD-dependent oxidoreductase
MSSTKLERVIIVGGGLGGLAAALSFYYIFPRHNLKAPSITVYERDKIENSRRLNEGYTLTLRNDRSSGGVQALKTIDEQLYRDIKQMAAPTGDKTTGLKLGFGINCDRNPTIKFMRNENDEIFRVARYKLRNRLVEEVKRSSSLSTIDLQWNSHVIKADYDEVTNKVTVELEDGRRDECDLLIGKCIRVNKRSVYDNYYSCSTLSFKLQLLMVYIRLFVVICFLK